jgi:CspA family cold shock protein
MKININRLKCITFDPHFNNTNNMETKNQGTVKFFNKEKGFGFIRHNDSDQETFVHVSGLVNDIKEGDQVEFDLQNGKKGLNAVNVTVV